MLEVSSIKAMLASPDVSDSVLDTEAAALVLIVTNHNLDEEKADMLACIRREHGAQLARIDHFLRDGFTAEQIVCAYDARAKLSDDGRTMGTASLGGILEAEEYFADSEDAEHFQGLLLQLPDIFPGLDYCDTMVKVALSEAQKLEIIYLGDLITRLSR